MAKKVVLAYSGGLDTSVAVRWLSENHGVEVICVAVDVGQSADSTGEEWESIRQRALAAGATEAIVVDARAEMAEEYCVAAIKANAAGLSCRRNASIKARCSRTPHSAECGRPYSARINEHRDTRPLT